MRNLAVGTLSNPLGSFFLVNWAPGATHKAYFVKSDLAMYDEDQAVKLLQWFLSSGWGGVCGTAYLEMRASSGLDFVVCVSDVSF